MDAGLLARRRIEDHLRALERKDLDAVRRLWAGDVEVEFPAGSEVAGRWRGAGEVCAVFETLFERTAALRASVRATTSFRPWSLLGRTTVVTEWDVEERRADGRVARLGALTVVQTWRFRPVRVREYWFTRPADRHEQVVPVAAG